MNIFVRPLPNFPNLHFTASQKSYERVVKSGEEKSRVFKVGAPGLDVLNEMHYSNKKILADKLNLNVNKEWLIVLQHPTPLDKISTQEQIVPTLKAIAKIPTEKIVIYPNNDTGSDIFIKEINKYQKKDNFHIYKNLDRLIYLSLLKNK